MSEKVSPAQFTLPREISTNIPEMMMIFRESISSNLNGHTFKINGIYEKTGKQTYHNGQYYYDKLLDKESKQEITLLLDKKFRRYLKDREPFEFTGKLFLKREIKSGNLGILFQVSFVDSNKDEKQMISESEYSLIKDRHDRGLFNIEADISKKLNEGIKPKILMLIGNNSIIKSDFLKPLDHIDKYHISFLETNLSNSKKFIDCINSLDKDLDYLAIVRGGGSGLGFFNQEDVCRKVIELDTPLITAIGHQVDQTMLEKAADKSYGTPTAFGNALENLVLDDLQNKEHIISLKNLIVNKENEYNRLLSEKEKEFSDKIQVANEGFSKKQNVLLIIIGGLLLFCLILVLLK